MFVVFWGTSARAIARGVVVDACPACRQLRPFAVRDYFAVTHFYWIDLAGGTFKGTTRVCYGCSSELEFLPWRYSGVLATAAAASTALEDGLTRSNAQLASLLDSIGSARQPAEPYREPGIPESVVSELTNSIEGLVWSGYDVTPFVDRFVRLRSLSPEEVGALAAEVRSFASYGPSSAA